MTVCDIGCASSIVSAHRFRTVAKSFTAGAHTPAIRCGRWVMPVRELTIQIYLICAGARCMRGAEPVNLDEAPVGGYY